MKKIFEILLSAVAAIGFVSSCEEPVDSPVDPVPDGQTSVLTLVPDKTSIFADGSDAVTFTVMKDEADVTGKAQITVDGLGMTGNVFTASKPGRYAFKASYDGLESETKVIEAVELVKVDSRFEKHVAVWEFTGAWCTFCPSGYSTMNFVVSRNDHYKETVHLMAFHSDSSGEDDLAVGETDRIMSDMNVGDGFPSFLTELRTSGGLSDGGPFKASLAEAFEDYPSMCGVALASSVSGSSVKTEVRLYPELSSAWRIAVFAVEDNVKYYQKDGSITHDEYNHRHVVRKILSSSYVGDRLGDLKAGEEVSKTYEFELDPEWNQDNTYVYALAIDYNGHVNNMNICKINGESDYNRL